MTIIVEDQYVKADVRLDSGALQIDFAEEPVLALSETVLVDLMQRSIGVICQNTYHHIGALPPEVTGQTVDGLTSASLLGHGALGREIRLNAPVRIVRH